MNDTITLRGIVATEPRSVRTEQNLDITSLRLASPSRRWDRSTSSWTNGETNWYTITAFRSLAQNVKKSINKGDRIIVCGRLKVRQWERDDRSGTSVEIDADTVGHDLAWGRGTWMRVPRETADENAAPGETSASTSDEHAADPAKPVHAADEFGSSVPSDALPSEAADPDRATIDAGGGPMVSGIALSGTLHDDPDAGIVSAEPLAAPF